MNDLNAATGRSTFLSDLAAERNALKEFVGLLEQEQQALLGQDGELVLSLAEQKTQMVAKLNEMAEARRMALSAVQEEVNTEDWLSQHAPSHLAVWNELRRLAESAQQANLTNGKLIHLKLRYTQQTLNALYSAAQNTTAGLYGRDGQQNLSNSGRPLGTG